MKSLEELQAELDANIPQSVISKRDGGGGKKLDYLTEWYVADRLNQIFGSLNWSRETVSMQAVDGGKYPTYVCKVRITVHYGLTATREGTGYGSDKSGFNAHEMAVKEAESDAFKRAAARFGRSLGLALYDKSQEYVDDYAEPVQNVAPISRNDGATRSNGTARSTGVTTPSSSSGLSKYAEVKPSILREKQNEDQKQKINNYSNNKDNQISVFDKETADSNEKGAWFGKIGIALMTASAKGVKVKKEYEEFYDRTTPSLWQENKTMYEKIKSEYPELRGV